MRVDWLIWRHDSLPLSDNLQWLDALLLQRGEPGVLDHVLVNKHLLGQVHRAERLLGQVSGILVAVALVQCVVPCRRVLLLSDRVLDAVSALGRTQRLRIKRHETVE